MLDQLLEAWVAGLIEAARRRIALSALRTSSAVIFSKSVVRSTSL